MDILQNSFDTVSFVIHSLTSKIIFWLLLVGSIYILLKEYSRGWRQLAFVTCILSLYAAVIVPIMNWKSGAYKCIVQGNNIPRGRLDFCREGMYAWYGENLWQWVFGIGIALIFIVYFYINNRDSY
ncbi:hypothetical protein ACERCG_12165 [Mannheimia sp. E30BD]|uniref:hypothetical protein n=1 Tax=Mannheimia sp. E30BD TaxID=3278708 RepID=UPI00359CBFBB